MGGSSMGRRSWSCGTCSSTAHFVSLEQANESSYASITGWRIVHADLASRSTWRFELRNADDGADRAELWFLFVYSGMCDVASGGFTSRRQWLRFGAAAPCRGAMRRPYARVDFL